MPKITEELQKIKQVDLYALSLFCLYNIKNIPEYSSLSELAFVFDKENLLKFIEYFGGQTITVPTIEDIEQVTQAILLYKYVRLDKIDFDIAVKKLLKISCDIKAVKKIYHQLDDILSRYNFG